MFNPISWSIRLLIRSSTKHQSSKWLHWICAIPFPMLPAWFSFETFSSGLSIRLLLDHISNRFLNASSPSSSAKCFLVFFSPLSLFAFLCFVSFFFRFLVLFLLLLLLFFFSFFLSYSWILFEPLSRLSDRNIRPNCLTNRSNSMLTWHCYLDTYSTDGWFPPPFKSLFIPGYVIHCLTQVSRTDYKTILL